MQQGWISFVLLTYSCILSINARAVKKGSLNETLLVGQINGPSGGAARNLLGMLLSMNVFLNNTALHTSLVPITNSTFPFNYSIRLTDEDFKLENATHFSIVSMIWQPAYILEDTVKLPENEVDTLNLTMRTINFVIIRGQIVHDNHSQGNALPGTHIKLELIEPDHKGQVIDQVDFMCISKTYPCPFEYWLDTAHIKANVEYKLEAIISGHILPARKTIHEKHKNKTAETKASHLNRFKIDPTIDTEINNYKIVVSDVE